MYNILLDQDYVSMRNLAENTEEKELISAIEVFFWYEFYDGVRMFERFVDFRHVDHNRMSRIFQLCIDKRRVRELDILVCHYNNSIYYSVSDKEKFNNYILNLVIKSEWDDGFNIVRHYLTREAISEELLLTCLGKLPAIERKIIEKYFLNR